MQLRTTAGVAGAACMTVMAFVLSTSAFAATTATITGANINASGTQVSVSNVQVNFDSCGGFSSFYGFGGCGAKAGVVPATSTCPSDGSGMLSLWQQGPASYTNDEPRTFNSGAKSVSVNTPTTYRICAYSIISNSGGSVIPASETATLRADALTPAPNPPGETLNGSQAKKAAAKALAERYGKRYLRGRDKTMNCDAKRHGIFKCHVSWWFKTKKTSTGYAGTVVVSGSPDNPKTVLKINARQPAAQDHGGPLLDRNGTFLEPKARNNLRFDPHCSIRVTAGAESHAIELKTRCNFSQHRLVVVPNHKILGMDHSPAISGGNPKDHFACERRRNSSRMLCQGKVGEGASVKGLFETAAFSCDVSGRVKVVGPTTRWTVKKFFTEPRQRVGDLCRRG